MTNHDNQSNEENEEGQSDNMSEVVFLSVIQWGDHSLYSQPKTQGNYVANQPVIPYAGKISSHGRAFKFQAAHASTLGSQLNDGDILFCEPVEYMNEALIPLQLYLLVMKEEFLCRRFFREDRHYEFRSDNPEWCHLIVSSNLILEVWEVRSILKTQIPAPEALFNELKINTYKHSTI